MALFASRGNTSVSALCGHPTVFLAKSVDLLTIPVMPGICGFLQIEPCRDLKSQPSTLRVWCVEFIKDWMHGAGGRSSQKPIFRAIIETASSHNFRGALSRLFDAEVGAEVELWYLCHL